MILEKVAGPFAGYYIACYATRADEGRSAYIAYFKVCASRPVSYWEADCLLKHCSPAPEPTADAALAAAQRRARLHIAALPQPKDLQAHVDGRPLHYRELQMVESLMRGV
jgi:hypothetical protein